MYKVSFYFVYFFLVCPNFLVPPLLFPFHSKNLLLFYGCIYLLFFNFSYID